MDIEMDFIERSGEDIKQKNELSEELKDGFSGVMGGFFDEMNHRSKYSNVAIYVDYDNVYWSLMKNFQHDPDQTEPSKNLFIKLWEKYGQDNIRSFRAYADFEFIRTQLTSLQQKRIQIKHVYSKGKDTPTRKNSSDIELCIDAIENTYRDEKTSCYVIVTADSDMIPLLSRLMYKGKRVELFFLSNAISSHIDITRYAHQSYDLLEFLNVDQVEYDLNLYILDSLKIIDDWWVDYKNENRFLGAPYLIKYLFQPKFGLPETNASELFEKLVTNDLIQNVNKDWNGKPKPSVALSIKGQELLEKHTLEVAAGSKK